MTYKEIISARWVVISLCGLLAFLSYLKIQQYRAHLGLEKEKQRIIEQEASYRKKNNELSQTLSYLNSPDFKEKLAREQLNLKKNGEVVYSFSEKNSQQRPADNGQEQDRPNYQKWIFYFTK